MYRPIFATLTSILLSASSAFAQINLLMAEEPGCIYCAQWNAQVAPIYPKTGEGVAAPLRRIDITDPIPSDINLARRINFTPTFILLVDGQEVNRLEGFPGEDFFWGLLAEMLKRENIPFVVKTAD